MPSNGSPYSSSSMGGQPSGGRRVSSSSQWVAMAKRVGVAQACVGVLLGGTALCFTYGFTSLTGTTLGALMLAAGGMGWLSGWRRSVTLTNAHLLACVLSLMLSFQWMGAVVRSTSVDCSLSHLHILSTSLDAAVTAAADSSAMKTVFHRMNELEDALGAVQEGAVSRLRLEEHQRALRARDLEYVTSKLDVLRKHAARVSDDILQNPGLTQQVFEGMSVEERARLQTRLNVADSVIARIRTAHPNLVADGGAAAGGGAAAVDAAAAGAGGATPGPGSPVTFEEYKALLEALSDVTHLPDVAGAADVVQAKHELAYYEEAIARALADQYHTMDVDGSAGRAAAGESERRLRRAHWEANFANVLAAPRPGSADAEAAFAQLARHCESQRRGQTVAMVAGVGAVLLQIAAAFVALSLTQRLPRKVD